MGFLAPLFLFGLLAAAIPLAIHLIRREKPPQVAFSSLRFLKQTTRKLVLFQQIQQWLLLLLRALLICLLVFAFARPLFYQTTVSNLMQTEPQSVVILTDTSLSMRYGEQYDRLQSQAAALLGELNPADEVAVVSFSSAPRQVRDLSTDHGSMHAFLQSMDGPDYAVSRFYPALRMADDLLDGAQHERRRVVLLSDFQAAGMEGGDPSWLLSPGVSLETIDVGDAQVRNLTLADVRSPARLVRGVSDYEVLARVRSTGTVNVSQGRLSLSINGEVVAEEFVDLSDASEAVVSIPVEFDADGSYAGELLISGDDFPVDNRYYFSVDVQAGTRVLVVNGAPSQNWYEDAAHWFVLAIEGVEAAYQVQVIEPQTLAADVLANNDVVALLNVGSLEASQHAALESFASEGGGVFLAPGDRSAVADFNAQLSALAPGRLESLVTLADNDYLLIADRDRRHPVLAPLDVEWAARFQGYWQVEPHVDSDVVMRFDNAAPALLDREVGQGRVMMMTSPLDLSLSNLPLQGLYLPFVHESLEYLSNVQQRDRSYRVGDTIDFRADLVGGPAALTLPDGTQMQLSEVDAQHQPREPGFFRLGEQEDAILYAVNIQPGAGDMRRMPPSQLLDRIINPETAPRRSERVRSAQLMQDIEQPQRLWWWILLLVLLLMLAETLIANRTYR